MVVEFSNPAKIGYVENIPVDLMLFKLNKVRVNVLGSLTSVFFSFLKPHLNDVVDTSFFGLFLSKMSSALTRSQ